jgi:hypothetical protein
MKKSWPVRATVIGVELTDHLAVRSHLKTLWIAVRDGFQRDPNGRSPIRQPNSGWPFGKAGAVAGKWISDLTRSASITAGDGRPDR